MTTEPNRVDAGVPTGGQFATKIKSDHVPSLGAPVRRPELEGWPESLPEPEVNFSLGDDGGITTTVSIEGESIIEAWHDDDDVHDTDSTVFESKWLEDQDTAEAAELWARGRHSEIARELRTEMQAAVERARARVLAKATGKRRELGMGELNDFRNQSLQAANRADEDLELASVALSARAILKEHPTAATADLQTGSWDNGDFVSGAVVNDAEGNRLYEYVETPGETDKEESDNFVVDTLRALDANAEQSYWAGEFSTGRYGDELYTIDLRKAAAWTPGDPA